MLPFNDRLTQAARANDKSRFTSTSFPFEAKDEGDPKAAMRPAILAAKERRAANGIDSGLLIVLYDADTGAGEVIDVYQHPEPKKPNPAKPANSKE